MKGLYFSDGNVTYREDLPTPEPREGETRIQVLTAGICATDLALRRGYMDFSGVPGHEFVGRALDGPLAGERVVGEINAGCGRCRSCREEQSRHCAHRTVLGIQGRSGTFAEVLCLPTSNLHPVPSTVSTDAATFTEPLAAAMQILAQVNLPAEMSALVIGDGKLGLLCAWVLARQGLKVTVAGRQAGRHSERPELLPPGVEHRTGMVEGPPAADARLFATVVDATGNPEVLQWAVSLVRPRGLLILKTTTEHPVNIDLARVVVNEINILGSRCGPFPPALEALATGDIPVERFIEHHYPIERGVDALEHAAESGTLKVLLDLSGAAV